MTTRQHKQQLSSAASYVRSTGAGVSARESDRSLACFSCQPRERVKSVKLFVDTQKKRHRTTKLKTKFHTTVFLNCGVRESKSTKGQNGVAFVGTTTTTRCDKPGSCSCPWPQSSAALHSAGAAALFSICPIPPLPCMRSLRAGTRGSSRASGPEPGRQNTERRRGRKRKEAAMNFGETDEDALGAPGDEGALVSG